MDPPVDSYPEGGFLDSTRFLDARDWKEWQKSEGLQKFAKFY